jgi:hypothetical protein
MTDRGRPLHENLPITALNREFIRAVAIAELDWPTRQEIEYRMYQDGVNGVVEAHMYPDVKDRTMPELQEDEDVG